MAQLKKSDLIKKLVEDYGYEAEDLKTITNGKLQAMINQEEEDAKELASQSTRKISKAIKFKEEDLIAIMSGCGRFYHRSQQTGRAWQFVQFGQIESMPFRELVAIRNTSPQVFEDGYIVILDAVVQDEFNLSEKYKNILTPDNVEEVFAKDIDELGKFIDSLPEGMKTSFIEKARELYESKRLDSASKIEFIQNKFDFSFIDNAPLSDIV